MVKASDSKSLGVSRAGSNPAVVVAFCLSPPPTTDPLSLSTKKDLSVIVGLKEL